MTPERDKFLIEHSKWYNRVFKSKEEIQNMPDHGGDEWQYGWYKYGGRAPIFTQYFIGKGITRIFQDCMLAFHSSGALGDSNTGPYSTEWLINTNGKEGESYQDAFDACFCEEMFVPLVLDSGYLPVDSSSSFRMGSDYEITWWPTVEEAIAKSGFVKAIVSMKNLNMIFSYWDEDKGIMEQTTQLPTFYKPRADLPEPKKEVPDGWIPWSDVKKPYDGAICDFCYDLSMDIYTAEYRNWISHPGGEATANAGPGFVDEHGFPAYEEPIWWRYHEEESGAISIGQISPEPWVPLQGSDYDIDKQYPRTPGECFPPGSKPTSSEDDDYYSTL